MDSTTKRLFSEIINYTRNNDCEFIFVSGDNVVIKPKNENNANCFKKVKKDEKDEWENKSFDANKVLRAFNLWLKMILKGATFTKRLWAVFTFKFINFCLKHRWLVLFEIYDIKTI